MKALFDLFRRGSEDAEDTAVHSSILFVCMGNICRSPTAEGVFRKVWQERAPDLRLVLDSAGTHAYHLGDPPDPRAQRAAMRRGIDLSMRRARRVVLEDFERFDLILAMDESNLAALRELCPPEHQGRVRLFLEFAPAAGRHDVPDPYYGGGNGFEYVLDLVEEASIGLLDALRAHLEGATDSAGARGSRPTGPKGSQGPNPSGRS